MWELQLSDPGQSDSHLHCLLHLTTTSVLQSLVTGTPLSVRLLIWSLGGREDLRTMLGVGDGQRIIPPSPSSCATTPHTHN